MARRKNTKFIDPRYFMNEKMEKLEEVKIDGYDYGLRGDDRLAFNRVMRGDLEAAQKVSRMNIEQVSGWWYDYKENAAADRRDMSNTDLANEADRRAGA